MLVNDLCFHALCLDIGNSLCIALHLHSVCNQLFPLCMAQSWLSAWEDCLCIMCIVKTPNTLSVAIPQAQVLCCTSLGVP